MYTLRLARFQTWKTSDGFEIHFGTNHLGHFLLTQLMLDTTLGKSKDGRVVVVSSGLMNSGKVEDLEEMAYRGRPTPQGKKSRMATGYCDSKLVNALFNKVIIRINKKNNA